MMAMIKDAYPDYKSIFNIEKLTLDFLRKPDVRDKFPEIFRDAAQYYKSMYPSNDINFNTSFELYSRKHNKQLKFHIGVRIKTDMSECTYCFAICQKQDNEYKLIRKFHIDFDKYGGDNNHPIFHIQYAGGLPKHLKAEHQDYYDSLFCRWLDEPRLLSMPTTLALLMNTLFMEFNEKNTTYIRETSEWKNIVHDNEEKVLKPYFDNCCEFLNSEEHKQSRLFSSMYCYGK